MSHNISSEGYGVRLRPVRMEDSPFIVWLRNLDHARGRIGDSAATSASQENWLKSYFEKHDDYYFIIETRGARPVGTYGLWDFRDGSAESGRWIIRPDVPAAVPSVILGIDLAFGKLGLAKLRVQTVSTNLSVLSLNKKFGMRQTGIDSSAKIIGGKPVDLVNFILEPADWNKTRPRLLPLAQLAEKQILDWENAQPAT